MRASDDTAQHRAAVDAWRRRASAQQRTLHTLVTRVRAQRTQAWHDTARRQWCHLRDMLRAQRDALAARLDDCGSDDDMHVKADDSVRVLVRDVRAALQRHALARNGNNDSAADEVRALVQRLRDGVAHKQDALRARGERLRLRCAAYQHASADDEDSSSSSDNDATAGGAALTDEAHVLHACFARTARALDALQQRYGNAARGGGAHSAHAAVRAAIDAAVATEQQRAQQCLARTSHAHASNGDVVNDDDHDKRTRSAQDADASASPLPRGVVAFARLLAHTAQARRSGDAVAAHDATVAHELLERAMRAALPCASRADIRRAVATVLQQRQRQVRLRAAVADYTHATAQLQSVFEAALRTLADAARDRAARDAATAQQQHAQQQRARMLAQQRAAHDARQAEEQASQQRAHEEQARAAAAQRAREARALQRRLRALAEYEQRRAEARAAERELAALRAQEQAAAQALRAEHNAARVAHRQRVYDAHKHAKQVREADVAQLHARKQAALQRFFAEVEAKLHVLPDPQRVRRATASTLSAQSAAEAHRRGDDRHGRSSAASGGGGGVVLCGYSDEEVMRDPRVQLYHALLEAGLHTSPYAGEVLARSACVPAALRTSVDNTLAVQTHAGSTVSPS